MGNGLFLYLKSVVEVFLVAALPLWEIRVKIFVKNSDSDGLRYSERKSKPLLLLLPPIPGPIHERENGALGDRALPSVPGYGAISERAVVRIRPAAVHELAMLLFKLVRVLNFN
jgi:hypothetical protein